MVVHTWPPRTAQSVGRALLQHGQCALAGRGMTSVQVKCCGAKVHAHAIAHNMPQMQQHSQWESEVAALAM